VAYRERLANSRFALKQALADIPRHWRRGSALPRGGYNGVSSSYPAS
jgi:hypothetical protein